MKAGRDIKEQAVKCLEHSVISYVIFFIDFESCRKLAVSLEHLRAVLFFNAAGGNIV